MPSPFPGVDPFIEDRHFWEDFHRRFINYWCEAVAERLPNDYVARIDERFQIFDIEELNSRHRLPDVSVVHDPLLTQTRRGALGAATIEPITRRLVIESEERSVFIEIHRQSDERLVAVLELLSPSNKQPGYLTYLNKRNELLLQNLHLVEVDLLIGGRRLPVEPDLPAGDCFAFISRMDRRPWCDIYAWDIKDKLPTIPIPLLAEDDDIFVDLQAIYDTAYDRGQYPRQQHRLYAQPLSLPVDNETRRWADAIVRSSRS
jgi:hypothetical protein